MHIFLSGVGGAGIGPLALLAKEAGYEVSGSDKQDSQYMEYLRKKGVEDIYVGQSYEEIADLNQTKPIDWYVYSSAVDFEDPDSEELRFCHDNNIKTSKRDALINHILEDKKLELIAVAGTHGKTTTTAMLIWLFTKLEIPISYAVGAKMNFGDNAKYHPGSKLFIYEADEFDRNFLAFEPSLSLITGVSWDHHEIFPTREDYQQAFSEFIGQSKHTVLWQEDYDYLDLQGSSGLVVESSSNHLIESIKLIGLYNRLDAFLAIQATHKLTGQSIARLTDLINSFPGTKRRMEMIAPNLYSDYAHTPEKIRGAMSVATELAAETNQAVVIIYEPLTNRRQHYILDNYEDSFNGAKKIYWVPSYLAREDPSQPILSPKELISRLSDPSIAEPVENKKLLKKIIMSHLKASDMVIAMSGGSGGSLDEWLRLNFSAKK